VVLAFGRIWTEAAMRARAALLDSFDDLEASYAADWRGWLGGMRPVGAAVGGVGSATDDLFRTSLMALRTHECPSVPGARIASLGVPWAALQNDSYPAACHLVRARDVAAAASALLAAGDAAPIREALCYLHTVQEADGHWPQNFWLDGMAAWQGLQLDEIAQPILLADLALRREVLSAEEFHRYWPMVRAAALSLARHDPMDGQDRWGHSDGLKLHTLATEIAALLAAADWASRAADPVLRDFLHDTADSIHELLEALLDEPGSPASSETPEADPDIVSLARLGVLAPDDPRLQRALETIDANLRVELPGGPAWCRRGDFGRAPRPALTAERAQLAIMAGRPDEARALLASLQNCAGEGGMLPERVDSPDGRGGIVMPHVWTHAEHVRLLRAIEDRALFEPPPHAASRYASARTPRIARWRHDHELPRMVQGRALRIELPVAADLHWSDDGWIRIQDTPVVQAGPGIFVAELPTESLLPDSMVVFTWRERGSGAWLGVDHHVQVVATKF
jgi:glucoamylase